MKDKSIALWILKDLLVFTYVHVFCLHVCLYAVYVSGACRGWKWIPDPLELEVRMVVICLSSLSIAGALDCQAISPAPLETLSAMQARRKCCLTS